MRGMGKRMRRAQRSFGSVLLILSAVAGGCRPTSDLTAQDTIVVDEGAILEQVANGRYRSLRRVNEVPYVSALDPTKTIDLFITPESFDAYSAIAPETTETHASVPV